MVWFIAIVYDVAFFFWVGGGGDGRDLLKEGEEQPWNVRAPDE